MSETLSIRLRRSKQRAGEERLRSRTGRFIVRTQKSVVRLSRLDPTSTSLAFNHSILIVANTARPDTGVLVAFQGRGGSAPRFFKERGEAPNLPPAAHRQGPPPHRGPKQRSLMLSSVQPLSFVSFLYARGS